MSLLDNAFQRSFLIKEYKVPDGRGGEKIEYAETGPIYVAYSFDASTQSRTAEQAGATNRFTLTTRRKDVLRFHDIVKRAKDGHVFRVTSDGDDNEPPKTSSLDMRQVEAEKWSLPNG